MFWDWLGRRRKPSTWLLWLPINELEKLIVIDVLICVFLCENCLEIRRCSNLFPLDAVNFGATKFTSIPIDFPKGRWVFRHRRWHHRACGNCRLVVCFINTVNRGGVSRLECWHVWAGRWEDGLCGWHRRRTRWRCRTHFSDSFLFLALYLLLSRFLN